MKKLLTVLAGLMLAVLPITGAAAFPDHPAPVCTMSFIAPNTLEDAVTGLKQGFWYEFVVNDITKGTQQASPYYAENSTFFTTYYLANNGDTYQGELYGINTKNGSFYSYTVLKTNCQITVP